MKFEIMKFPNGEFVLYLEGYEDDRSDLYTIFSMFRFLSWIFNKSQNYYYNYIKEIVENYNGKLISTSVGNHFNLDKVKDIENLLEQLNGFLIMEKLIG